jgi:hypothetical protein
MTQATGLPVVCVRFRLMGRVMWNRSSYREVNFEILTI